MAVKVKDKLKTDEKSAAVAVETVAVEAVAVEAVAVETAAPGGAVEAEESGKNRYKLSFSVGPERFEDGLQFSYNKNKGHLRVQGFRPGKAPRKLLELNYGKDVFFEDAINFVLQDAYKSAADRFERDAGKEIVSEPDIHVGEAAADKGVSFTAEVYVKPAAAVSGYLGLGYTPLSTVVTESELYDEIEKTREKNARTVSITDRPVKNRDIVKIDFTGYLYGEPFEGGKGEGFDLTIGSHTFVDNFEDQLIGHSIGDEVTVKVTFPKDYGEERLAGKYVTFEVKINEIRAVELPLVDDEFAQDVSEFETLEEYKADLKAKLEKNRQREADQHKENEVMNKVRERTAVDIPAPMIERQMDQMMHNLLQQLRTQGLSMDMYLQYTGQTSEGLRASCRLPAENQVKSRLALEAIADKEHLEATDAEIDEEIKKTAQSLSLNADTFAGAVSDKERRSIALDIKVRKALDKVLETAKKDK